MEYLEALLTDDTEEMSAIEEAAFALGFGPLVECSTACNMSVQKTLYRSEVFPSAESLRDMNFQINESPIRPWQVGPDTGAEIQAWFAEDGDR